MDPFVYDDKKERANEWIPDTNTVYTLSRIDNCHSPKALKDNRVRPPERIPIKRTKRTSCSIRHFVSATCYGRQVVSPLIRITRQQFTQKIANGTGKSR